MKYKAALASNLSNIFEWYDFTIFVIFAEIIAIKFFPSENESINLLQVLLIFALGYVARPLGAIIFGWIGDKYGRKKSLTMAILCMAIPTASIGIIPIYDDIGIISGILVGIMRIMQGISLGGLLTGAITFSMEHANKSRRSFISSFTMATICSGLLMGSFVSYLMNSFFSEEDFTNWAWRIPFIGSLLAVFIAYYLHKYIPETPIFQELQNKGKVIKAPLIYLLKFHWKKIFLSIFINATGSVLFYFDTIYIMNYLKIHRKLLPSLVDKLMILNYVLIAIASLFFGWIADKTGYKKLYLINICFILISGFFITKIFAIGSISQVIIAQILLAVIIGAYLGPEPGLQASIYPNNIRNTGLSVSYNIATSLFGGLTPYVCEKIVVLYDNNILYCNYYIVCCAITSLIAIICYKQK